MSDTPQPEAVRSIVNALPLANALPSVNALSLPGEPDLKSPDAGRAVGPFDEKRAEAAIRELLVAIGEDPERDGLLDTPGRVARAYREMFAGLRQAPEDVLSTTFDLGHDEMVL